MPALGRDLKRHRSGTHRCVDPKATLGRLSPLLPAIGVTRVANVTGLDYIGIPVVVTARPLARSLSVQQGKGLSVDAAKASAVMESVESHSAQRRAREAVWFSRREVAGTEHALPRHLLRRRLAPDRRIPWVDGFDLLRSRPSLVPEELVQTDFSDPVPEGHGWFAASSNGLGAGNTETEALLHALCELVERDAFTLWCHAPPDRRAATRFDPEALPDSDVAWLRRQFEAARIALEVWDITSDIGIPAFYCEIDDPDGRAPRLGRFGGVGCHPSAAVALCRALCEAAQSRLTFIVGSREDLPPSRYALLQWQGSGGLGAPSPGPAGHPARREPPASIDTDSVADDLAAVLARLAACGVDSAVAVTLTDPELDLPCVRVVVEGLEGPHDRPGFRPGERLRKQVGSW